MKLLPGDYDAIFQGVLKRGSSFAELATLQTDLQEFRRQMRAAARRAGRPIRTQVSHGRIFLIDPLYQVTEEDRREAREAMDRVYQRVIEAQA